MRCVKRNCARRSILALAALAALGSLSARADEKPTAPKSIWEQDTLTGDWSGARTSLHDRGINFTLTYIDEVLGVLSGGIYRRPSYEGRFEFSVDTDLQKLVGWTGATTHFTVYQIHNIGHTTAVDNVRSIADPSNIDALATTRLFTAWFQQNAFDDRVSLRVGQLAADDEFLIAPTAAAGLINGTFGWASIAAANLAGGGPAYPLATPAARLAVKPTDQLTLLTAVFSGNPAGSNCTDTAQACDRYGTKFSFSGGALWISELQYGVNQGKNAVGLPGIYKLGGWYATADYADVHYGLDALGNIVSLTTPPPNPLNHPGNWGIYGVADQAIWAMGKRSVNLFMRGGFVPSDRNTVSYYLDGGVGLKGLLPGREDDVLTFGAVYEKISPDLAALDRDFGPPTPVRNYEAVFELDYAMQIAPWWTLQPDLQYIVHPGGNVLDPKDPAGTATVKNAFIAGIRSTIKF